jgi:hypothetical protein
MAKKESGSFINARTAKFAFQSNVPSSSDSAKKVPRDKVIIDNKMESPFQSNRKLKQKANIKKLENDINNYELHSANSIG